jgi:hypothetical protein
MLTSFRSKTLRSCWLSGNSALTTNNTPSDASSISQTNLFFSFLLYSGSESALGDKSATGKRATDTPSAHPVSWTGTQGFDAARTRQAIIYAIVQAKNGESLAAEGRSHRIFQCCKKPATVSVGDGFRQKKNHSTWLRVASCKIIAFAHESRSKCIEILHKRYHKT